jgi:ABC-type nitrate/sulfonate/bicarbonate transport system ATPase subunit
MSNIELKDIYFDYGENQTKIFSKLNLEFKKGEIFAIFAPNGTGKSTLLQYILNSTTINKENTIGYIPQKYNESFFNWLSIKNNIQLVKQKPIEKFKKNSLDINKTAKDLNINIDLNLRPLQCSGGMLQQASILRAFSIQPNVIIADEPFASLDYKIAKKIIYSMREMVQKNNMTMIVVLHNIEDIKNLCDRVLVIPSKPFSTSEIEGHYQALIIENEFIKDNLNDYGDTNSFLNFVKDNLMVDTKVGKS